LREWLLAARDLRVCWKQSMFGKLDSNLEPSVGHKHTRVY
jgi:hypothetical protein